MKVSNAVVGGKVQIKRDCVGYDDEDVSKGLVCTVSHIVGHAYELRLEHPDIEDGYAWVNASDCRKYKEVTEEEPTEPTPELTYADVQVGDWLVYNEGDWYLQDGVAYQVVEVREDDSIRIANHTSDIPVWQSRYWTRTQYFNKVLREVTPRG